MNAVGSQQNLSLDIRVKGNLIKMSVTRKYFPHTSVLWTLIFCVRSSQCLQYPDGNRKLVADAIQKYFPLEKTLCVVLSESVDEAFLPPFHVPVIVFTKDQLLQGCGEQLMDQDGYVLLASNAAHLERQMLPLLKCFNETTLKLKTKYILVLDLSKESHLSRDESYSRFFHNLWNAFGIINIAVLHVQDQKSLKFDPLLIISYDPFLARHLSPRNALRRNTYTQDVRGIMIDRFRNMHGQSLRTVFYRGSNNVCPLKDFYEKQTLGADPVILLKQILEENLNASFEVYEPLSNDLFGTINKSGVVEEIGSGKADYCINFSLIPPGVMWLRHVQLILTGYVFDLIFVVPMPRKVESWRLFQYIFQWQVCVGLSFVLFLLSGAALLFVHVFSTLSHKNSNTTSEIVALWKASLSVSTNRLPTTHSQRSLITLSLLIGVIFPTLFSAQLFSLVKSKPRSASIKTLQDVHDSNLPIYTVYKQFSSYLNSFENTTLHRLKDNLKTDKMYEKVYYLDSSYLNITDRALVSTNLMIKLATSLPQNKAFLQYFEVVKEPMLQTSMVMFLPTGSVYYDHFNYLNERLISGGFYLKWFDANKYRLVKRYSASPTPSAPVGVASHQSEDNRVPLNYDDLRLAFYILYVGLTVSVVCFIKEVLSH